VSALLRVVIATKVIKDGNQKDAITAGDTGIKWNSDGTLETEADGETAIHNDPILDAFIPMPEDASFDVSTNDVIIQGKQLQDMIINEFPRISKCIERGFKSSACHNNLIVDMDMSDFTISSEN